MSTLAAARADNFYFPPEWTPEQGSLNKFHGSHGALGDRARKLDQGILIIRFEMPFNVWCLGCKSMIAKGVRFNAEKKQIGKYLSSKIWSFTMKAPCCRQTIEIHTDPKNAEYIVVQGAERKIETYEAVDAEVLELADKERLNDPLARLEHVEDDARRAQEEAPRLARIQRMNAERHGQDYSRNKALRKTLRDQKKRVAAEESEARAKGLAIRLLPAATSDAEQASATVFASADPRRESPFVQKRAVKRAAIRASSIFAPSSNSATPLVSSSSIGAKARLLAKRARVDAAGAFRLASSGIPRAPRANRT
eukprot:jgi/Chlat1/7927/Chrsp68S07358